MRIHWLATLGICCLVAVAAVRADTEKKGDKAKKTSDKEKIQGTWKAEDSAGGELIVEGDKYTQKVGDMTEEGTFKLDSSKKPHEIDIKIKTGADENKTQLGIYSIEGDTLKLCVTPAGSKDRPKEFMTKEDSESFLLVFKRAKK